MDEMLFTWKPSDCSVPRKFELVIFFISLSHVWRMSQLTDRNGDDSVNYFAFKADSVILNMKTCSTFKQTLVFFGYTV